MSIVLFAYNFPHKKTQDFLFRLAAYDLKPRLLIASPPIQLTLPKTILRDKYRHIDLIAPKELCDLYNVEYIERSHNHESVPQILKENDIDLGIIAGARILKKHIIDSVRGGIVNFHPGLIPENRGLNAAKMAIYNNIQQGMTVHLIDQRIDAGRILKKFVIPVYDDDSLIDINLRIYESQLKQLTKVVSSVINKKYGYFTIPFDNSNTSHPPADTNVDKFIIHNFDKYKNRWSLEKNGWLCSCGSILQDSEGYLQCVNCGQEYLSDDGLLEFVLLSTKS